MTIAPTSRRLLLVTAVLGALVTSLLTVLPAAPAGAATACTASAGPAQQRLERYLDRRVDGRQSRADCRAIRRFQWANGIRPALGYAGSTTGDLVRRLQGAQRRSHLCAERAKVVCVDLTTQTVWVARRGVTTWGPYAVRSGRDGYETRTGVFHVQRKDIDHVSSIYGSPMPYAMFFSGGQAFHTSDRYLYDPLGSHGCVHILAKVARAMWDRVSVGTTVQIFGRKPGT